VRNTTCDQNTCFFTDFGEDGMKKNETMLASVKLVQLTDIFVTALMMYGVLCVRILKYTSRLQTKKDFNYK
jgi:hypothetical protein